MRLVLSFCLCAAVVVSTASADVIHFVAGEAAPGELARTLEKGADINARDSSGMTPLMHAALKGNVDNVRFLLKAKADIAAVDSLDRDALDCALLTGQLSAARALIEAGAYVDRMYAMGQTRLTMAALRGDIATVHLLLLEGADPQKKSRDGLTPKAAAEKAGDTATIELLASFKPVTVGKKLKGLSEKDSLELYSVKTYESRDDLLDALQAGRRSFAGCTLKELDLADVNLSFVDLRACSLDGCDLRGALLLGTDLRDASVRQAYLRKANLQRAKLESTVFTESYLTLADLRRTTGLDLSQVRKAQNLFGTTFDEELVEQVAEYCKPLLKDPGTEWVTNPWFAEAKDLPGLEDEEEK